MWLPAGVVLTLLLVVAMPLVYIALQAFGGLGPAFNSAGAPLSGFSALQDPLLPELIWNTLSLGLLVSLVSLLIAAPLAICRGLYRLPYARMWDVMFLIPFMLPPYIGAMAWTFTLQPGGYSTQLLKFSGGDWLFSLSGMVTVMALHLFPVVYFTLSRTLSSVGNRYAEAASVFGAAPLKRWLRILLPLSVPSIAASMLMVFSLTIEEYGTPSILGQPSQFLVLVTRIEEKFAEWPIDLSGAAFLSIVLLLMALTAYGLHHWLQSRRSAVTITGKHHTTQLMELGWMRAPVMLLFGCICVLAVVIPLFGMLATAFSQTLSGGLKIDNLGLAHFRSVWQNSSGALDALLTSWGLAFAAAAGAGLLGVLSAWMNVRHPSKIKHAVGLLTALPNALPGMVLAVGMILAWNQSFWPIPIYNTIWVLLLAYICLLLPYPVRYTATGLQQISQGLDDAARTHGASAFRVVRRILMPMLAPHVLTSMLLVFAVASRELVASVMLAPAGTSTVSTYIFNQFAQGSPNEGMALAVIAVGLSTALLVAISAKLKTHSQL